MNNNNSQREQLNVVANVSSRNDKRGRYIHLNANTKLIIAKRASRDGVIGAINCHKGLALKYSSVSLWKVKYEQAKRIKSIHLFIRLYFSFCNLYTVFYYNKLHKYLYTGSEPTAEECGFVTKPKRTC